MPCTDTSQTSIALSALPSSQTHTVFYVKYCPLYHRVNVKEPHLNALTSASTDWHQPALAPIARSATYVVTSGITSQCTLSYWSKLTTISLFYLALFAFYLQLYHDSLSTQCFVQWKCCVCCMYCYFLKAKYDMYICYTRDKCRPVITFLGEFMISNWY